MEEYIDFWGEYIMGCVQMVVGFYFLTRFLGEKVRLSVILLFVVCAAAVLWLIPMSRIAELVVFALLLTVSGALLCRANWKSAVLSAVLVVELMQLCYGVVNSCLNIVYPFFGAFNQYAIGVVFMLSGDLLSLLFTGVCCHIVWRYFFHERKTQALFLVMIPILMIFIMEESIHSVLYEMVETDSREQIPYYHYQMLVLQLLEVASLFCMLFAYQKLLQSFRLSTEVSLLEQEERSLNQYVEEARVRYEKTASFRHDIKNHLTMIKKLLQNGMLEQAFTYMGEMEEIEEELPFPCSTNNPVIDILIGNKLGIAKNRGIDVCCSLLLPYPCRLRDIDLCIIFSNALDNAIQACKEVEDPDRYIHVRGQIQGDFLYIEIENSCLRNHSFQRGTGLSNIKAVTEKYQGAMSIKTEGTMFVLQVLLIL